MPFEDSNNSIDTRQEEIKNSLNSKEGEENLFKDPSEYAETFINEVDKFQKDLDAIDNDEVGEKLSKSVLELLEKAITPENIDQIKEDLKSSLDKFAKSIDSYEGWKRGKAFMKEGDTLSKIVMTELGLSRWDEAPKRLFSGVRKLQEYREANPTLPFFQDDGVFSFKKAEGDVDNPTVGELLDLSLLADLKNGGEGKQEDIKWYADKSPKYAPRLNKIVNEDEANPVASKSVEKKIESDLQTGINAIDDALQPEPEMNSPEAKKLLAEQTQIREKEAQKAIEMAAVDNFYQSIKGENTNIKSKVAALQKENEGWAGYGHAIEPSNLVASLGGGIASGINWLKGVDIVESSMDTKESINLQFSQEYLRRQQSMERGLSHLIGTMRGVKTQGGVPMDLKSAAEKLKSSGDVDFNYFLGSPEGHMFEKTVIQGKEASPEDQAEYLYNKGLDLLRMSPEDAEPYFQTLIAQYPGSPFAAQAKERVMKTSEKAYKAFTEFGDVMLRLDMLALMAVSGAVGVKVGATKMGASAMRLMSKYPQLSKTIPGVRAITAGSEASRLTRVGIGFTNFALELGKFTAYSVAAEKVGGDKAAYGVGMLCFFMPGLIQGFEKAAGQTVEKIIQEKGVEGVKDLADHVVKGAGGPDVVREALFKGLLKEAKAAGKTPNLAEIMKKVDEAMAAIGVNTVKKVAVEVGETGASKAAAVEGELSGLDKAIDKIFINEPGAMEKAMSYLKVNFESLMASIKNIPEASKPVFEAFRNSWGNVQKLIEEGFESSTKFSAEKLRAISQAVVDLAKLFVKLPKSMQEALAPSMLKMRSFLTNLGRKIEERPKITLGTAERPTIKINPVAPEVKPTIKIETASAKSAAELFTEFKNALTQISKASKERLDELSKITDLAVAKNRIKGLNFHIESYRKILDEAKKTGSFANWGSLNITGDHSGRLKGLAKQATTYEEREAVVNALIRHTEDQANFLEKRVVVLKDLVIDDAFNLFKKALDRYKQPSAERLHELSNITKLGEAKSLLSQLHINADGYWKRLTQGRLTREFNNFQFLGVTRDHGGRLQDLARRANTYEEREAILVALREHTEAQIRVLEERVAFLEKNAEKEAKNLVTDFVNFGVGLKNGSGSELLDKIPLARIQARYELIRKGAPQYNHYSEGPQLSSESYAIDDALNTSQGRQEIRTLLCELFGVSETATQTDFKKAYRALEIEFHPDHLLNISDPVKKEQLIELGKIFRRANELVSDQELFTRIFSKAA